MKLIIVESPTKSKSLGAFLGKDYQIAASFGHVRDLPKSKLGIDVENNFEPQYVIPTKSRKTVNFLKKACKEAENIILAVDEDREGEAIAFHLKEALGLKDHQRIVFHEITKNAILQALQNPRQIDMQRVNAQVARRVLDRLVGYKLSPLLWKKVARGLSAGRVQSVAVRLIVERERKIEKFIPQEYWEIAAELQSQINANKKQINADNKSFLAKLVKKDGKRVPKFGITNKKQAEEIVKDIKGADFIADNIERKEVKKNPLPPFTTSSLQQTAGYQLHFSSQRTMSLAQKLYERGLITYHRTDSLSLSEQSLSSAKSFILKQFGEKYWPGYFRKYKTTKKGAQEAHEAIRPARPELLPEKLNAQDNSLKKLYQLIWQRFIASQMKEAVFDSVNIKIKAKNYTFQANGQTLKFDGFLRVYPMSFKDVSLPRLTEQEKLKLLKLEPTQHFTQPPARYNEPSLIKILEEKGIGRPSTYAPIISTIQKRNYVQKNEQKRFFPTEIGTVVNDLLVEHFPKVVDIEFTAKMEEDLDKIAQGQKEWQKIVKEFYEPFARQLEEKYQNLSKQEIAEQTTDKICPQCGAPLIIKLGRFGKFYACSKFPECKYTESLESNKINIPCPKCKDGFLTEKRTRKGKIFYGCSRYPACDFALWDKPTKEKCPKCGSLMVETKRGKIACSNKECKGLEK
jgi:DNA topoisomerase I